jgi:hypothetical protein
LLLLCYAASEQGFYVGQDIERLIRPAHNGARAIVRYSSRPWRKPGKADRSTSYPTPRSFGGASTRRDPRDRRLWFGAKARNSVAGTERPVFPEAELLPGFQIMNQSAWQALPPQLSSFVSSAVPFPSRLRSRGL